MIFRFTIHIKITTFVALGFQGWAPWGWAPLGPRAGLPAGQGWAPQDAQGVGMVGGLTVGGGWMCGVAWVGACGLCVCVCVCVCVCGG